MPCSVDDTDERQKVLHVNTADVGGGAERVAWDLSHAYRKRGHGSWLAVGHARTDDPNVIQIPNDRARNPWARAWRTVAARSRATTDGGPGIARLQRVLRSVGEPTRAIDKARGHEDFGFPGTWRLLGLPPEPPSIIHLHNLHGGYFDLRALPYLTNAMPTVLTLHDAWLFSGHCSLSFDCDRWTIGCGHCPDLTIYPSVRRDATAGNWRRKERIFARSRLYVAAPSAWLLERAMRSSLAPSIVDARVLNNGVDLSVFTPSDRSAARSAVGIPDATFTLVASANGLRNNPWKDYETVRSAVILAAERIERQVLFVGLGEDGPTERAGRAEFRFVRFDQDPRALAPFYQAADVYVHGARAEVWGLTITEALACGTPVIASAIGGIPEQIDDGRTGLLVPQGDAKSMAAAIIRLHDDDDLRRRLATAAAEEARRRFGLERQADRYLGWYNEIRAAAPPTRDPRSRESM